MTQPGRALRALLTPLPLALAGVALATASPAA